MDTVVLMRCGDLRCALERAAVREIAPMPLLPHPPSLPSSMEGVMNLGGEAILVVDLAKLLGVGAGEDVEPLYRHIVVLGQASEGVGLLVDRVEDVRRIDDASLVPAAPANSLNGCVTALADVDGVQVNVLDAGRIFLAAEQARLADIRQAEQARLDALEPT